MMVTLWYSEYLWYVCNNVYPPVNRHRPCQIGVGRLVSITNWWFSRSMFIYQRVISNNVIHGTIKYWDINHGCHPWINIGISNHHIFLGGWCIEMRTWSTKHGNLRFFLGLSFYTPNDGQDRVNRCNQEDLVLKRCNLDRDESLGLPMDCRYG